MYRRRPWFYSDPEFNYGLKRFCRGNGAINEVIYLPQRSCELDRSMDEYDHLKNNCATEEFKSNHLIEDHESRIEVLNLCHEKLGRRRYRYVHVQEGSRLYKALVDDLELKVGYVKYKIVGSSGKVVFDPIEVP